MLLSLTTTPSQHLVHLQLLTTLPLIYLPMHPLFTTPTITTVGQNTIVSHLDNHSSLLTGLPALFRETLSHSPTAAKQIF